MKTLGGGGWNSLPEMMLDLARQWHARPMLRHWQGGNWRSISWGEFARDVAALAAFLRAQGVAPGDRVLLVSENRPEFPIADTAIMAIGAVTVPTYVTNLVSDHAHILRDSGASAAIVSTKRLAERVAEASAERPLDLMVCMEAGVAGCMDWQDAVASPADAAVLLAEAELIPPGRLACLVYTSGTGGLPKGVMLPHRAMLANREGVARIATRLQLEGTPYLSFLPLSHSYEHTVGGFLLPSLGLEVVYSRGADRLAAELKEIRPTVITAVPRLFEVLKGRIEAQVEKEGGFREQLFRQALAVGLRVLDGQASLLDRAQHLVLDRLVGAKIRERFGGRLKALVSGGARLDPDLSGFFLAFGLPVIQGYGQTEAGPVISVNPPWANQRHSVGPPLPGVEARIAEDGELCVRGDLVMDGYWNDAENSARALAGGWLHTGDVGEIGADGYIRITDRKRDFIKTLGGDMVSPAKLEGLLMAEPEIAQAVVAGEGRPAIVALVVPAEGMEEKAHAAIARVNGKLSNIERIRGSAVVAPFTVENGMLTPTMKVKRRIVLERHAAVVEGLQKRG